MPQKSQKLKPQDSAIKCPHCGSDQLTVGKHSIENGFDATSALVANYLTKSSLAGFWVGSLNSGGTESELFVYCFNCQAEFSPDELSPQPSVKKNTPISYPKTNNNSGCGCYPIFIIAVILVIIFAIAGFYADR